MPNSLTSDGARILFFLSFLKYLLDQALQKYLQLKVAELKGLSLDENDLWVEATFRILVLSFLSFVQILSESTVLGLSAGGLYYPDPDFWKLVG